MRRLLDSLLVAVLVLGACGDPDDAGRANATITSDTRIEDARADTSTIEDEDASADGDASTTEDEEAFEDASADLDASGNEDAGDGEQEVEFEVEDDTAQPPPVFDLALITDPTTADCTFGPTRTVLKNGVLVDVQTLTYISYESLEGTLHPILIRAFFARPSDHPEALPGVVTAHGLGGFAKEEHATGLAVLLDMATLAYTGPGGGDAPDNTSEGKGAGADDGYRLFDTLVDPRGSWFWGHAVAGMRGLTCLASRADVDPERLGFTGFSAGGVATLIASSVDPRVRAAVPLSASGRWDVATQSPRAWQHQLLGLAGLTTASPAWTTLLATVEPGALVANAQPRLLMVDGTTDEFFPLTSLMATWNAVPGTDKRLGLAGNFDHGCYALSGVESASDIEARAALHAEGGQRLWFRHAFGTDPRYATMPAQPTFDTGSGGAFTVVHAVVDEAGYDVVSVKAFWSNDDAFVFGNVELERAEDGHYTTVAAFPTLANTILYVDVEYRVPGTLEGFALSSAPIIPSGLVPHIRAIDTCL